MRFACRAGSRLGQEGNNRESKIRLAQPGDGRNAIVAEGNPLNGERFLGPYEPGPS